VGKHRFKGNFKVSSPITLAVIPARAGSKGLPNKNLQELQGISLIGRAVILAKSIEAIQHVIVTTDSELIAEEAEKYGAELPFIRSPGLAQDLTTTEATLKDALMRWEGIKQQEVGLCVYFSPSEGFLNRDCVERGIEFLTENSDYESYFSAAPTTKNFWESKDAEFNRILDWMSVYGSRQNRQSILREDTGRGCVSRSHIWRDEKRIGNRIWLEQDEDLRANLDIHTALDLKIASLVLSELGDHLQYKGYLV